jgi:DNA-binding transcriptional ArsR family regulator
MNQSSTQVGPPEINPDAYPAVRVSTEFHLRGFDLLTEAQGDAVQGLIVMTLVRDQMGAQRRKPAGVRALSRRLGMPYTTIRRHVEKLTERGQCIAKDGGLVVPPAVLRGRRVTTFLRKIYVNAVRLLVDLTRVNIAAFAATSRRPVRSGRLSREQTAIAVAATGLLLAGMRATRGYWGGDLVKGLVYTAISAANVKHVTNSAGAAIQGVLPDSERQPVSVLGISRSLRLPYETIRRHAEALLQAGICVRVGRNGLLVPTGFIRAVPAGSQMVYRLVMDFLAELRRVGVKA